MIASAPGQLLPLLSLGWRMVRSRAKKAAILTLVVTFGILVVGMIVAANRLVSALQLEGFAGQALIAYPAALLLFTVVAVIAPFLAGGAIELFPASNLVAYPVAPRTRFTLSLVLMPFNLTWLLQVVLLAGLVAIGGSGSGRLWTLAGVTAGFVVAVTVAGQALAWVGTAVRLTRTGRALSNLAIAVVVVVLAVNGSQNSLLAVADSTPLLPLLGSGLAPFGARWVLTMLLLGALVLVARSIGVIAVGWSLRLSTETSGSLEGARRRRRRTSGDSPFRTLTWVLVTSVLRSKPIRRGLVLLVAMPVVVAAVAELEWTEVVVIPGLVSAGAALLFSVNGFSLLGGGTAWVGSLPARPSVLLSAVASTAALVIVVTTTATTAGVAAFASGSPDTADLVALVGGAVATSAWAVATSLSWSVKRPFQADLRGSRDTPAPPGVMAGYSMRLAGVAGLLGLVMVAAAQLESSRTAAGVATVVVVLAVLRITLTVRAWSDPPRRANVFLTTAFG